MSYLYSLATLKPFNIVDSLTNSCSIPSLLTFFSSKAYFSSFLIFYGNIVLD